MSSRELAEQCVTYALRIVELEKVLREARDKLIEWHKKSELAFGGGELCDYDFCRGCGQPEYMEHKKGCEWIALLTHINATLKEAA